MNDAAPLEPSLGGGGGQVTTSEPFAERMPGPAPFDPSLGGIEPLVPDATPEAGVPAPPAPAVQSTRRLLGASFDMLTQSTAEMRGASFYIGAIVLATIGPVALATLAIAVRSPGGLEDLSRIERSAAVGWYALLEFLALAGLIVAAVESRNMAAAILGGRYAGRPIGVRAALARSRMAFWRAIAASIIVGIPVSLVTQLANGVVSTLLHGSGVASLVVTFVVGVLVGAPLAYVLCGVVLGDVGAVESVRRSLRVYAARKAAAAFVAGFDLLAVVIVIFGAGAGLGLISEVADALGLGTDAGPLSLAIITICVLVLMFAFGTLIFTALAIALAPQVVMFVGLTRATMGLDHVRPGGDRDPAVRRRGQRPFRWATVPMLLAVLIGVGGLVAVIETLPG